MFNSLKSKLTIPIIAILVAVVLVVILYSSSSASDLADDLIWARAVASSNAAEAYIAQMEVQTNVVANAVASNYDVLMAIRAWNNGIDREGNRQILINHLNALRITFAVDSFTVRDFEGRTIVRLHDLDFYYDIDGLANAVNALQHRQSTTSFTSTAAMPMSLITTVPIIDGGAVIGTMAPIFHFNTEDFVDHLSDIFDAPVSIYRGRETVASALMIGGRRAVEVEVSEEIGDIVIEQGISHLLDHYIDGEGTISYYKPFLGAGGNPIGMMAVHFSTAEADAATSSMVFNMIVIGIIGLIIAAIIMYVMISRNLKPLGALADNVRAVAAGNLNVNIDLARAPKDEIGAMTKDVYALVDVVKTLVDDVAHFAHEANTNGDIEYRIDASKYQGSYNEVVASLNEFTDGFVKEVLDLLGVLGNVNKGNFNADFRKLPGKKAVMNEIVDALIENLNGVSSEITAIIKEVSVNGNVEYQIDTSKFEGSWQEIAQGLNDICEAVGTPISEIMDTLKIMNDGRFDARVNGNYAGVFKAIKDTINEYVKGTDGYMQEINNCMGALAQGDLNRKITMNFAGDYAPVKEAVNNITTTLHKTISEINAASENVLSGAKQISTSATDLANGAQEQASSIEELNASIDMINQQTSQNANDAAEANDLSNKSTSNAKEGNDAMKQMLVAMEQIKESSNNISKIIKTIQDIAFQTNLLSLNAAVEAARAGEHGKGFSVVAEEVRNLANRSQQAAIETTGLIEDSINRVESGASIAGSTSESLDIIVKNASEVLEIINNISNSSKDQADGISQVSVGLSQISQVVQSNSAVSEEAAAASEELTSQAEILRELVSFFKL